MSEFLLISKNKAGNKHLITECKTKRKACSNADKLIKDGLWDNLDVESLHVAEKYGPNLEINKVNYFRPKS